MASPLVRWLAGRSVDDLAALLARRPDALGVAEQADLAALAARLQGRDSVAAALAALPRPAVQVIGAAHSLGGPTVPLARLADLLGRSTDDPELTATLDVLAGRALVWPDGADLRMAAPLWSTYPHPLGLGQPGPGRRAPFDARPPELPLVPVDPAAVDREAVAAALEAVRITAALGDHLDAAPVALVKAGGVGSREVRRLARLLDRPEAEIRFWLELAYAAGLIGLLDGEVRPTSGYDDWFAAEPADRLAALLRAWTRLPAAPLTLPGADAGVPGPVLVPDNAGLLAAELRPALLRVVAGLPAGRALADGQPAGTAVTDGLAAALAWELPVLAGSATGAELTARLWREAHLVGAVAHGAPTPLGRALTGDPADLANVADALVPRPVARATFLTDLTAVVPGLPAAPLAALLDRSAVRESTGTAGTWRFTAESVRAALDAGWTTADLLDALRDAAGGDLPQALSYLVSDLGRQHGRIRLRAPGCVLRIDDPALGAELLRARALRPLGLVALAPTVLASNRPETETLSTLRAAGYLPIAEDADGGSRIERVTPRRAPVSSRAAAAAARHRAARPDPRRLAELLLADAPDPDDPDPPMGTLIRLPVPAHPTGPADDRRRAARRAGEHRAAGEQTAGDWTAGERAAGGDGRAVLTVADQESGPVEATLTAVRRYAHRLRPAEQAALAAATVRGTPVRIAYRNRAGEVTSRIIEPIDIDQWLLGAWCHLRGEERTFLLDRIEAVSPA